MGGVLKKTDKSPFQDWFKRQFGRIPSATRLSRMRNRQQELEAELITLRIEFQMESALHAAWTAALYGWNAKHK